MFGVPLLIIPFAIYNIVVFLMPGLSFDREIWHFRMASEGEWGIAGGDLMVAGSIFILLIEMVKAARTRGVVDHLLSMLLFVGMVVEFLMVKEVASGTFALLLVISFADVAGGLAISRRAGRRNVAVAEVEHVHSH
jgi:hypothetical protein